MNLPYNMQAMIMDSAKKPLVLKTVTLPSPGEDQVLIKVIACGVCRTDLHILDGELLHPKLPLIPGHEIIGIIAKIGANVQRLKKGDFVGVPWLGHTCGKCRYCLQGMENLCDKPLFTGYTIDGGYAQFTVAYAEYCFPLDAAHANVAGAPLLCAGLIGYRSYSMTGPNAENIGIYGFGAAAHIITQVAIFQNKKIFAFTRNGDTTTQEFALKLGARWAGNSSEPPPVKLDAAIIFAPDGQLVPQALGNVHKGGTVICGGIHMSDIPSFPYNLLWEERQIRSVANLTRSDGEMFFSAIANINIQTEIKLFPLQEANEALYQLRTGKFNGAAVLVMPE